MIKSAENSWGLLQLTCLGYPMLQIQKKCFSCKQHSPTAGTIPTLNLPCFTRVIVHFCQLQLTCLGYPMLQIQKNCFSCKQHSPTAGTIPTLNLPCFTRVIVHFWLDILLLVLRFLWAESFFAEVSCHFEGCTETRQGSFHTFVEKNKVSFYDSKVSPVIGWSWSRYYNFDIM
jgi:hypothetical protein